MTDGGGKVRSAMNAVEGAEKVADFLVSVAKPHPGQWWRPDFRIRFTVINGLPGIMVVGDDGAKQASAFELEGGLVKAIYVVRNPDKLRHIALPPEH